MHNSVDTLKFFVYLTEVNVMLYKLYLNNAVKNKDKTQ